MTEKAISESGMVFGPYPSGHCFHIEKSGCYRAIQEGVQIAEFVLLRQQQQGMVAWVVEAKQSSPAPWAPPDDFDGFIDEIRQKFINSFLLAMAAILQRHPTASNELPESFKSTDLKTLGFRFVLVVNGHKKEWLPPLKDALSRALRPVVKTWALPALSVMVLNHEMAREQGLILAASPSNHL